MPWSAIASFVGNIANNANIDHQVSEQRKENQANRDWNLNLAKQQNQWNIEQWNRENEYNSPAAQMARYKAAGLNPDLIYGQQNLSAASPEMTAGDGSQPTDVSNLANKRTMLDMVSASLDNRLKMEQLKGLKEDNEGKRLDNKSKEYSNYFHSLRKRDEIFIRKYFTDGEIPDSEQFSKDFNVLLSFHDAQLLNRLRYDSEKPRKDLTSSDIDIAIKKVDRKLKEESVQTLLDDLAVKLKITKAEAEYYIKTVALRIKGVKLDNKLKENDDFWSDPGIAKQLPEGIPTAIRVLNLIFRGH